MQRLVSCTVEVYLNQVRDHSSITPSQASFFFEFEMKPTVNSLSFIKVVHPRPTLTMHSEPLHAAYSHGLVSAHASILIPVVILLALLAMPEDLIQFWSRCRFSAPPFVAPRRSSAPQGEGGVAPWHGPDQF